MNERIDQLLIKAGAYFGGEGVVYDRFDPKKFAELIVRECLLLIEVQKECLCDDEEFWSSEDYAYEMAINDAFDTIKEQFGVEE